MTLGLFMKTTYFSRVTLRKTSKKTQKCTSVTNSYSALTAKKRKVRVLDGT